MQAIVFSEKTISEGNFQGKTFRHTNEKPIRTSVIDWIKAITGLNSVSASKRAAAIINGNTEIKAHVGWMKFPGQGQRPTPVTDARGLVRILLKLPHKYIATYENACIDLIVRYLGADDSIKSEIDTIRQAYEQLPADHPMQFIRTTIVDEQAQAAPAPAPAPAPIVSVRWDAQRAKSKDATKAKSALMQANVPGVDCATYARTHALIGKAVTGEYPSEFKRARGIPKSAPTRDFWTTEQLGAACAMEGGIGNIARTATTKHEFETKLQTAHDLMFKATEFMGLHHKWLGDMPAEEVAEAAMAAERRPTRVRAKRTSPAIAAPAQSSAPQIAAPAQSSAPQITAPAQSSAPQITAP